MIKYKASRWNTEITPVEVVRETPKQVVIKVGNREDREAKDSTYHKYHDTWEEAYHTILSRAKGRLRYAERELQAATENLAAVQQMEKP